MIHLIPQVMLTQPLSINGTQVLPAPRTRIPDLRLKFIELYSIWLGNGFGIAETVASDRAWELMKAIASVLPLADNPAVSGIDLEPLSNDYELLERLFFHSAIAIEITELQVVEVFLDKFRACDILKLHRMDAKSIIYAAYDYRKVEAE
jgi:hypothetical protein